MNKESLYILYLVLLGFFGLSIINYGAMEFIYLSIVLCLAAPSINKKGIYAQTIKLYSIFVLLSCLYSYIFNNQFLFYVIGRSYDYFAILAFFMLLETNLSSRDTLKILEMLALTFCIGYIIQWLIYPTILFSMADINASEDKYRARMVGSILCYFLMMYATNQFLLKNKIKYILYGILGFFPIIMQGFRAMVALTAVAFFGMIPFVLRSGRKTIFYFFIGIGLVSLALSTNLVQSKMEEMMGRQEREQTFENDDYVRLLSLDYYWNQQFTKPYEKVFGGGKPVDLTCQYTKDIHYVKDIYGFFWTDLGLVGLGLIIGFPAVTLLIVIYIICIWKCKEPEIQFVRFTFFIVLVGSLFTNAELYREGNILLLSLFLYFEYKYHKERQSSYSVFNSNNTNTKIIASKLKKGLKK